MMNDVSMGARRCAPIGRGLAGVATMLVILAPLAGCLPARRAARADAIVAMSED